MKKYHFNNLFYTIISILGLVSFYLIFSYDKFLERKLVVAILVLFLVLILFKYFNPESTIIKILKILLICSGLFYSVMIITNRFLYFTNIQINRNDISSHTSVNFEKNNFQVSLAKAKKANKLIFLDIYTGWCGPCLQFSKTVLKDVEVSETLNSKFINLKYDAEVGEGIEVAKKYLKGYYPTILILDSNGNIIEDVCKNDTPDTKTMRDLLKKYK